LIKEELIKLLYTENELKLIKDKEPSLLHDEYLAKKLFACVEVGILHVIKTQDLKSIYNSLDLLEEECKEAK